MGTKHNKYGARSTDTVRTGSKLRVLASAGTDGYRFASRKEEQRYKDLRVLEIAGKIMDLEVHPRYPFIINGELIGSYTADFRWRCPQTGEIVVEDVKAFDKRTGKRPTATEAYRLRKRLMRALYQIDVREITGQT